MITKKLNTMAAVALAVLIVSACTIPGWEVDQSTPIPLTNTPPPTITHTPVPATTTPTPLGILQFPTLSVIFAPEGAGVNVYDMPGEVNSIRFVLDPHEIGLIPTGQSQEIDGVLYIQIENPSGDEGWVDSKYLTGQVSAEDFCNDPRRDELVDTFLNSIRERDSEKFISTISPSHGLIIHSNWWNTGVPVSNKQIPIDLFRSDQKFMWGRMIDGDPLSEGSFSEVILPELDRVIDTPERYCNTIELGLAAGGIIGYSRWPFEYAGLNYIALYKPAPPDDELDWSTLGIGIEYDSGNPYVMVLVLYKPEL